MTDQDGPPGGGSADRASARSRALRRRWWLGGGALLLVVAVGAPVLVARDQQQPWRLVWSDDFTTSTLDPGSWTAQDFSTFGDGNLELACLTARPANLTVSDGSVQLVARRESPPLVCGSHDARFPGGRDYSSALIATQRHRSWTYARVEVRAALPTASGTSQGLWPGIWMRPDDLQAGEIDILEVLGTGPGAGPATFHQTLHFSKDGRPARKATTVSLPAGFDPTEFHVYSVETEPGHISWSIDGTQTYSLDSSDVPDLDAVLGKPYFLRLNLAVGGNWPGPPDASTVFPAPMKVDWVHVYQRGA